MTSENNDNDMIEIYKGNYYSKHKKNRAKRVVVFDLDETLGSFVDLEILWELIVRYKHHLQIEFDSILDLYPEFIRYGILSILEYLYTKKTNGECYKVYLYTNNQSTKEWVQMIVRYFNNKISPSSPQLFDQLIYAFKINNVQIELNRTTTKKTHDDFIRCTMLPSTTSICFIDDFMYKDMKKERIYYIKPKAYRHHLSTDEIITRFVYSKFGALIIHTESTKHAFKTEFIEKCMRFGAFRSNMNNMKLHLKNDILVSQKLMYYLKEYFLITNKRSKTRKRRNVSFTFTRKKNELF
jgi:hypothetical protein